MLRRTNLRRKSRRILKVTAIVALAVIGVIAVALWAFAAWKNDFLMDQIQSFMSESQSGEAEIESVNLRIFHSFPDITVELGGINYYEHADSARTPNEVPILEAKRLFVAIKLLPLIKNELRVSEVSLTDARVNIFRYADGKQNIALALAHPMTSSASKPKLIQKPKTQAAKKAVEAPKAPRVRKGESTQSSLKIELEYVSLQNVLLKWHAEGSPDSVAVLFRDVEADLLKGDHTLNVTLNALSAIQTLSFNGTSIPAGDVTIDTEFQYDLPAKQLVIRRGEVDVGFLSASIHGSYTDGKEGKLDMNVDASSSDLQLLSTIIKPEVLSRNPTMLERGDVYVKGRVFGDLKKGKPQFDFTFGVNDLDLQLPRGLGKFSDVGFDGRVASGSQPDYREAIVEVVKLRGTLPDGGYIKGGFTVTDLKEPFLKLDMAARITFDGFDEVFNIKSISELRGKATAWAKFDGPVQKFEQHEMDSNRSSAITLDNISFTLNKTRQKVSGLSARIENRHNRAIIQNLTIQFGENDLTVDATVDNLAHVLVGGEKNLVGKGHVHSQQLFTRDFLFDTSRSASIQDKISNLSFDFHVRTNGSSTGPDPQVPTVSFDVRDLKATFDELPDVRKMEATAEFKRVDGKVSLNVKGLKLDLPQGRLNVAGDMLIVRPREWQFNARVETDSIPWPYIMDVAAEIAPGSEPGSKNVAKDPDRLTAALDVSASVITRPFEFRNLVLRDSRIRYTMQDLKSLSAEKVALRLERVTFSRPTKAGIITGLRSARGDINLEQFTIPGLHPIGLRMNLKAANDTLDISFTSSSQMARHERGSLIAHTSGEKLAYHLKYTVDHADLESFVRKFYKKKLMTGSIDYTLDLKASGSGWSEIKEDIGGTVAVRGDSLTVYGVDIDNVLTKFKRSQNFNLTDVGAVLIAGPVGLAVTKGADFVSLATVDLDPSQQTQIKTLVTNWSITDRQLTTEDVAFSTQKNRIAIQGIIDLGRDTIPGLSIAVIDAKGCALMDQKLYGKTTALKTGKLNIAKTMLGSVINFVNALVGSDCVPVYNGVVGPPSAPSKKDVASPQP